MASDSAQLEAACPTCGATVAATVAISLSPIEIDGNRTVIPTCGITSEAHWCPQPAEPPAPVSGAGDADGITGVPA